MSQNIVNPRSISSTSQVAILSKVAACISQPVAFKEHLSTHWISDRPLKQASVKAEPLTYGSGVVVIS